ncbi:hypothetical protein ACHAXM_000765 [Skeletonema potamos]
MSSSTIFNSRTKSIGSWWSRSPRYDYEFTYDSSVVSEKHKATAITLFVVGTAMQPNNYSDLASNCATGQSMVFVAVDNNPNSMVKTSASQTAAAFNDIIANITARLGDIIASNPAIFVGGHSAGGCSAIAAMKVNGGELGFTPAGCLNADPLGKGRETVPNLRIDVPSFSIGFTIETCSVPPTQAGLAAYNITNTTDDNRVMMQVVNKFYPGKQITHCIFTNGGCTAACPAHAAGAWVRPLIGRFYFLFVNSIVKGDKTSKEEYEGAVEGEYKSVVNVFFGAETATV